MYVYIDLDGVLVDLGKGFLNFFGLEDPYKEPRNLGNPDLFWMCREQLPVDWFEHLDFKFWENLEPTPFCFELMELSERLFGEDFIEILSSPFDHVGCHSGKVSWVKKHFPWMRTKRIHLTHEKWRWATDTALLIDDRESNTEMFTKNGGHAYLVPANSNEKHHLTDYILEDFEIYVRSLRSQT